jgi:hypothetical protein
MQSIKWAAPAIFLSLIIAGPASAFRLGERVQISSQTGPFYETNLVADTLAPDWEFGLTWGAGESRANSWEIVASYGSESGQMFDGSFWWSGGENDLALRGGHRALIRMPDWEWGGSVQIGRGVFPAPETAQTWGMGADALQEWVEWRLGLATTVSYASGLYFEIQAQFYTYNFRVNRSLDNSVQDLLQERGTRSLLLGEFNRNTLGFLLGQQFLLGNLELSLQTTVTYFDERIHYLGARWSKKFGDWLGLGLDYQTSSRHIQVGGLQLDLYL